MSTLGRADDAGSPFAIAAGSLIDGRGGAPVPDAVVRVEGGRITAVGPAGALRTLDVPVRDFRRQVVMPGLVDVHAHPTLPSDRRDLEASLTDPDDLLTLTAMRQLTLHLRSGVTTVRDCAARGRTMFAVREAIQTVTRNAARLLGLDREVGTVEVGKDADLLVLDADPLADAGHLARVAAVFKRGVRIR